MRKLILIAFAIPILLLNSCSKEPLTSSSNNQNITFNNSLQSSLDFLSTEEDLGLFYDAILQTKMDVEINSDGPYTIFAPKNEAIENFLERNNWTAIKDVPLSTLTLLVQFHISKTDVKISDLKKGKYVPILYKERELFIDIDNPDAPFLILGITKANVINKDYEQNNGMINKIDDVLSL